MCGDFIGNAIIKQEIVYVQNCGPFEQESVICNMGNKHWGGKHQSEFHKRTVRENIIGSESETERKKNKSISSIVTITNLTKKKVHCKEVLKWVVIVQFHSLVYVAGSRTLWPPMLSIWSICLHSHSMKSGIKLLCREWLLRTQWKGLNDKPITFPFVFPFFMCQMWCNRYVNVPIYAAAP